MSTDTQSHSQLLFTYGPGAMLDLPDMAVIVSGLDGGGWSRTGASISEPRLTDLLTQLEGSRSATNPALRTPPIHDEDWRGGSKPCGAGPDLPGMVSLRRRYGSGIVRYGGDSAPNAPLRRSRYVAGKASS